MALQELETLNRALFLAINATPAAPAWLLVAARVIANDLILSIPIILLGLWLSGDVHRRNTALKACAVAFIALGANQLIGLVWQHPRPFVIGLGHTYLAHAPDSSFPSDHATIFTAVFVSLFACGMKRLAAFVLASGAAVMWARVFLGVHFPLDMIGAVCVASATYALVAPLWKHAGSPLTQLAVTVHRRVLAAPIRLGWLRP